MSDVEGSAVESGAVEFGAVALRIAVPAEVEEFGRRVQRAFTEGAVQGFGYDLDEPIPSDDDVRSSLDADGVEILQVTQDSEVVGGAVISFGDDRRTNSLDLFFIDGGVRGSGVGARAWRAIEERYPATEVWTTITPYFDTRNLHFYVNKCGFAIVEFFHPGHPLPDDDHRASDVPPQDGTDRMFGIRKVMSVSA